MYDANQSNHNHWKMNTKLALIELKQFECAFYIFGDMISRIQDFGVMTSETEGKISLKQYFANEEYVMHTC